MGMLALAGWRARHCHCWRAGALVIVIVDLGGMAGPAVWISSVRHHKRIFGSCQDPKIHSKVKLILTHPSCFRHFIRTSSPPRPTSAIPSFSSSHHLIDNTHYYKTLHHYDSLPQNPIPHRRRRRRCPKYPIAIVVTTIVAAIAATAAVVVACRSQQLLPSIPLSLFSVEDLHRLRSARLAHLRSARLHLFRNSN